MQRHLLVAVLLGLSAGAVSLAARPAQAVTVLADSAAEFSDTQGAFGWYYGYYETPGNYLSFQRMQVYHQHATHDEWHETNTQPPWTTIFRVGGHPGIVNGVVHQAVRRWVSDFDGTVWVSGTLEDLDPVLLGGVEGMILHNGSTVFSQVVDAYPYSSYGPSSVDYLVSFTVAVGDVIDFAIDPNGSEGYDTTKFTAVITDAPPGVPEVAGFGLLALGVGAVAFVARRSWHG